MRSLERTFVIAAAGMILFCAAYGLTFVVELPLPRYFPLEHRWGITSEPGAISQGWYGKILFTLLCSVPPAALADRLLARMTRAVPAQLPLWAGLAAAAVVLITLGLLMAHEFGRWGVL